MWYLTQLPSLVPAADAEAPKHWKGTAKIAGVSGRGGGCPCPIFGWISQFESWNLVLGGGGISEFFFGMTKIKGVKNWYCSLEMKEIFGMRPLAAAS